MVQVKRLVGVLFNMQCLVCPALSIGLCSVQCALLCASTLFALDSSASFPAAGGVKSVWIINRSASIDCSLIDINRCSSFQDFLPVADLMHLGWCTSIEAAK